MIWLDFIVLGILLGSALFGLLRGFVREVLAVVVWAAAFWVSMQQTGVVSVYLEGFIDSPTVRFAVAFIGLFVGIVVVGALISRFMVTLVNITGLNITDRMLGLLFGLIRGGVVVVLAVLLAGLTPLAQEQAWQESVTLTTVKPMICYAGADGWLEDIQSHVGDVAEKGQGVPLEAELPAYWARYCAKRGSPD